MYMYMYMYMYSHASIMGTFSLLLPEPTASGCVSKPGSVRAKPVELGSVSEVKYNRSAQSFDSSYQSTFSHPLSPAGQGEDEIGRIWGEESHRLCGRSYCNLHVQCTCKFVTCMYRTTSFLQCCMICMYMYMYMCVDFQSSKLFPKYTTEVVSFRTYFPSH